MEINFKDKKILVTGAGRGIGRALVARFVETGAEVTAISKTAENLETLKALYPSVNTIQLDIGDWEQVGKVLEPLSPFDHLVNNAGVATSELLLDLKEDSFDHVFGINVKGLIRVTQVIGQKMNKGGSILNVSSISGRRVAKGLGVYCASKAAVDQLTKSMAIELAEREIRVNAVCPTIVWNDMGKQLWSDEAKSAPVLSRIPLNRFASEEEVVNASVFLLSSKASMTTGATLLVDGGYAAN